MYLFILESIGTQELILIGIVALIFLGPRRLPEVARKIGKTMADLRKTTNEFKSTWEREADFEEETKALKLDSIEEEAEQAIARENLIGKTTNSLKAPEIKTIDKDSFEKMVAAHESESQTSEDTVVTEENQTDTLSDKRTWL